VHAQRIPDRQKSMATSWPRRQSNGMADALALAVIAAVAVIAALTFRDYGLGWDDYTHAEYGDLLLNLFRSGFTDRRALSFVNLYAYGGGFDLVSALAAQVLPFDLFDTRRLMGAAVGVIGLVITWRLARRVGGSSAGLVAVMLLAACPLYYGNMYINAKDAPFAVAMAFLTLALVRAFEEYPKPGPIVCAMVGGAAGLAFGTRVLGGLAGVNALAALAVMVAAQARTSPRIAAARAGQFLLRIAPGLVLGYAVMALVWPWSVTAPLNPFRALEYFSHFFEKPWREMFDGVPVPVPDMPRSYVPKLFLLQEPEIFLLLGLGGAAAALATALRRDVPATRRAVLVLLASAALFPIALAVLLRPAMYNGIRHFVFVAPAFAVLGGLAFVWVADVLGQVWRGAPVLAAFALLFGLILPPVQEMARLHPYEYSHFNMIAGGVQSARQRYMLDYWGLAFKQATAALRAKLADTAPATGTPWRVAVCGPERAAKVELGPGFVTSSQPSGADFALTMGEFYCAKLAAPVFLEIERDGVVYARVYDIRGMTVTSQLSFQ
jgi:hypothetical protein